MIQKTIGRFYQTQGQNKNYIQKVLLTIAIVFCASILTYNVTTLIFWYIDSKNIVEEVAEVEEIVGSTEIEDEGELINPPVEEESDYWYYIKLPFTDVDITELKKINADTVGFLSVAGTNINYPVVQTRDNEYYLNHTFKRQRNSAGWVFMDYRNNSDFSDQNTVIYGHSRLDVTMFGTLKNILSSAWINNKANYVIRYSSESENMLFQVFSVYTIPVESYYIQTNFSSSDKYKQWLDTMVGRSKYNFNASVNEGDKILTLSTCDNTGNKRIVMQAKLIKKNAKSM